MALSNNPDQAGAWRWTDGSHWNYTQWDESSGNNGDSSNCVWFSGYYKKWADKTCTLTNPFLCQYSSLTITGKTFITLNFTAEELPFSQFIVWYSYSFTNQDLVDSWQDKRMTGFCLSWFLQDSSGSRITEQKTDMEEEWEPVDAEVLRYRNLNLGW